jgi:predicted nuclease with TOPRIM domain
LYFSDSKQHLSQVLQAKLQAIAHFQSLIASVAPNIHALSKALNVQSEALLQLLHVHRMGPAWGAALVEVVRRKEYSKVFLRKAKEMADILAQFRAQEERRRETFKNEISRYLPVGLIDGLEDPPPYCEVSVSNTRDALPNLSLDDVLSFNQLVSSMRATSAPGDPNSIGSDSISKLQATMMKMTPQLEMVANDFEKIVLRSGFSDKFKKLEDENRRLRSTITPSRLENVEHGKSDDLSLTPTNPSKLEETIRIYEARIKSLEQVLQERYQASKMNTDLRTIREDSEKDKEQLSQHKKEIEKLAEENSKLVAELKEGNEKLQMLGKDKSELESQYQALLKQSDDLNSKKFQLESDNDKVYSIHIAKAAHCRIRNALTIMPVFTEVYRRIYGAF